MSTDHNPVILVIDDDRDVLEMICATLSAAGYPAAIACNGQEALDHLRGSDVLPGLILLDLMMPVMNGWQFRREVAADPTFCDIPIAIITAYPGESGVKKMGAVDVLAKPSRIENLLVTVERYCRRADSQSVV